MRRSSFLVALLLLCALFATACGDDSGDTTAPSPTNASTTSSAPGGTDDGVPGCGEDAATDPSTMSANRTVARCEPGAPAPKPLPEKTKVKITTTAQVETTAWLYLALAQGEFEAENLDVELVDLRFAEAMPQMLQGAVQAATGGAEAGWYNAVGQDIPTTWVLGNFFPPHAGDTNVPQTGLWVNRSTFSDPDDPDFSELNGKRLGSAVGTASVIMYPIDVALSNLGVDLTSMQIQQLPAADVVTALRNGSVDAAWLLDPTWSQVADDPNFVLAATQPPGEPLGGLFFGEELRNEKRDVGLAVIRAIVRTVNTYLAGDYEADPETVQMLADALDTTPEAIAAPPSEPLVFDWEIREGTTDRTQQVFKKLGVLNQDIIPEQDLVDRSLYLEVVGKN